MCGLRSRDFLVVRILVNPWGLQPPLLYVIHEGMEAFAVLKEREEVE